MSTDSSSRRDPVRISMWGPTSGGKTTFLAALRVATVRGSREPGDWRINGVQPADNKFLIDLWNELVDEHQFPDATLRAAQYSWHLNGDVGESGTLRNLFRNGGRQVDFVLEVRDIPGGDFKSESEEGEAMLEHLGRSDGIVYLFDPVRDLSAREAGEHNLSYFQGVLAELQRIASADGHLVQGRLPHRVAVCVAKFDDPAVFDLALSNGWVNQDSDDVQLPRVLDEDAKDFFYWLCGRLPNSDANLLKGFVEKYFLPDRVSYFVSSSIGFYIGSSGVFDERDFTNVVRVDDEPRIRGAVRPINVLEPLLRLERKIRTGKW